MKTIAAIHTIILNCLNKSITPEHALELIRQLIAP
jgi:hypothetical protein